MGKKYKFMPTKEFLTQEYFDNKKTYYDIAAENGVSPVTVHYWFKKYGLCPGIHNRRIVHPHVWSDEEKLEVSQRHKGRVKSAEERKKISESKKIKCAGHQKLREDGYIAIYYPAHLMANSEGYVMQHRLVVSEAAGRLLQDDEVVHHINGDRKDNRLENLKVMTQKEHAAYHMKKRYESRRENNEL